MCLNNLFMCTFCKVFDRVCTNNGNVNVNLFTIKFFNVSFTHSDP